MTPGRAFRTLGLIVLFLGAALWIAFVFVFPRSKPPKESKWIENFYAHRLRTSAYETCFWPITSCFGWWLGALRPRNELVYTSRRKGASRSIVTTNTWRCSEKLAEKGLPARKENIRELSVFGCGCRAGPEMRDTLTSVGWIGNPRTKWPAWTTSIKPRNHEVPFLSVSRGIGISGRIGNTLSIGHAESPQAGVFTGTIGVGGGGWAGTGGLNIASGFIPICSQSSNTMTRDTVQLWKYGFITAGLIIGCFSLTVLSHNLLVQLFLGWIGSGVIIVYWGWLLRKYKLRPPKPKPFISLFDRPQE